MRILFATDIHGNKAAYEELLTEAPARRCEAVILGGDILPKKGNIRDARRFIEGWLDPLVRRFRARHPGIGLYWMFGNDDWFACLEPLLRLDEDGVARYIHERVLDLDGRRGGPQIAGYACVPVTPFAMKDWDKFDRPGDPAPTVLAKPIVSTAEGTTRHLEVETEVRARGSIEADLAALAKKVDPRRLVLVAHAPPWKTALDVTSRRTHVGSKSLRAFIERYSPPLTLHGHIHESVQVTGAILEKLGPTVMVNPGASEGALRALAMDLSDPALSAERVGNGWA